MATRSKLSVILHADVVGSTALVRKDEHLAHDRIQGAFQRFTKALRRYGGTVHEIRGDALVVEFARASDAVLGALSAQQGSFELNAHLTDGIVPEIRVGIALGEVVVADGTLTGAGVVLAQRLEQLADPGGICISAAVREAVPERLPFDYLALGVREVKGFDEPVAACAVALTTGSSLPAPSPVAAEVTGDRANRQRLAAIAIAFVFAVIGLFSWWQPWNGGVEPADPGKMSYTLPDKPSIAVLPFDNLSGDADLDFLGDGLTENLIAVLSGSPEIFVIARSSSFAYRGKAVQIQEVAERFGVRYVLEGSVQRSDERIRVTAQLVDAIDGLQVWAGRYDRELNDVFAVQDDIANRILVELDVRLTIGDNARRYWAGSGDLETYRRVVEARYLIQTWSPDGVRKAERLLLEALERRPENPFALTQMGWAQFMKVRLGLAKNPTETLDEARRYAEQALSIGDDNDSAHMVLAQYFAVTKQYDQALAAARRALELAPSNGSTTALAGWIYLVCGLYEESLQLIRHGLRREPDHAEWIPRVLAFNYMALGRMEEAKRILEGLLAGPAEDEESHPVALKNLAVISAWEGDTVAARSYIARLREIRPAENMKTAARPSSFLKDRTLVNRYLDALREAGLPEAAR